MGGGEASLADGAARVTLVMFGHSGCGTNRLALPVVDRLATGSGDGVFVGCVLQEGVPVARELVGEFSLELPVLLDEAPYAVSAALGLVTVPTLITFDEDGVVNDVVEGYSRQDMEALAGRVGMVGALYAADDGPATRPG